MTRQPLTRYVAYVHWDTDHLSPPIGPFFGITEARQWGTEFRKQNATKRRPRQFVKISFSVMWLPEHALAGWVPTDETEEMLNS